MHPLGPDRASVHGTAVLLLGQGVLIIGPSGAGKSGLAAQLISLGAELISDDMVHVLRSGDDLRLAAPPNAPSLLELRGIGLVDRRLVGPARLGLVVGLEASPSRMPEDQWFSAHGLRCPLVRHPYRFDLAAKLLLWVGGMADSRVQADAPPSHPA